MNDNESIVQMNIRFNGLISHLNIYGRTFSNEDLVGKILMPLSRKWEPRVTYIMEAYEISNLNMEELINSLLEYEVYPTMNNEEEELNPPMPNLAQDVLNHVLDEVDIEIENIINEDDEEESIPLTP